MPFNSFLGAIVYAGKRKKTSNENSLKSSPLSKEMLQWIQFFDNRPPSFCHVVPTAYILDYKKSAIIYISPSIRHLIGFDDKSFTGENGFVKFIDLIHPNDFKVYNEQIFPKEAKLLNTVSYKESAELIFSTTLRVNQVSGGYRTLLLKKGYVTHKTDRLPMFEFGTLSDITPLKKELSITHTIERFKEAEDCASYTRVLSEDYFPDIDANIISGREKEILVLLSLGIKRKDVGTKLYISENTVANHIKTILRKTNSKNIREAIAICKMNGII
jgi:DNA-binding CsgD family transcriptional regulator